MKRSVEIYIKDIIEYMERAENHIKNFQLDQFLKDDKTCDAVIRCIEVIGEATKNIPEEIRISNPSCVLQEPHQQVYLGYLQTQQKPSPIYLLIQVPLAPINLVVYRAKMEIVHCQYHPLQ
ncbi:MAG: DUF86 domain-containing protein [Actinobacteria bacterium]|nr:DUF86 domain-containing protein [Actinomycetota bacterium]